MELGYGTPILSHKTTQKLRFVAEVAEGNHLNQIPSYSYRYDMMPLLPNGLETYVNELGKALEVRGIELTKPNETCDVVLEKPVRGFKCNCVVWKAIRTIDFAKEKSLWIDEIDQFPVDVPRVSSF